MANPLKDGAGVRARFKDMRPGESRPWVCQREGETVDFHRTDRSLAQDICDANNATMSRSARARGLEWFATANGDVRLGTTQRAMLEHLEADLARRERDRQEYNRRMRIEAERQEREAA